MTVWSGTLPTITTGPVLAADLATIVAALAAVSDPWTPYTPVWTGSGSNPVIGNGVLAARYLRVGKLVMYTGRMFAGSTTTYGSGTYNMSLPVAAADADFGQGTALFYDGSAATARQAGICNLNGVNNIIFYPGSGGGGLVTNTVPFTWANTDRLQWMITYQAA